MSRQRQVSRTLSHCQNLTWTPLQTAHLKRCIYSGKHYQKGKDEHTNGAQANQGAQECIYWQTDGRMDGRTFLRPVDGQDDIRTRILKSYVTVATCHFLELLLSQYSRIMFKYASN